MTRLFARLSPRTAALAPSVQRSTAIWSLRSLTSSAAMSFPSEPPAVTPKRPSPYRLFTPTTFLASFADLHVAGWRLLPLPSASTSSDNISQATGDLQDRRLVRLYEFQADQLEKSWRIDMNKLVQSIIKHGADTRHHPTIVISPAGDYTAHATQNLADDTAYVLELSTHTHTPLPPVGQPKDAGKMRPGVTMKDTQLAHLVEDEYRRIVDVTV